MLPPDLVEAIEEDHRALNALVRGDPNPKKQMFSHGEDVTLANPVGPPARHQVEPTLEGAVSQLREGQPHRFERVLEYATDDLAVVLEIERCPAVRTAGADRIAPFSLRATTVWRREESGWRILHRTPIRSSRPSRSSRSWSRRNRPASRSAGRHFAPGKPRVDHQELGLR